jgi:uncharacterized protein YbjT (DUF2867 family)
MKLCILGASGATGQWLTRLAVERGHEVVVVVRPGSDYGPPPSVVAHHGDVTDPLLLERALLGCRAVASCLGLRRAGRSPWAELQSPPNLTSRVTQKLLPVLARAGIRRLVAISAGGVGDSLGQCAWPVRQLMKVGQLATAYEDLNKMEAVLVQSSLDWAVARPVTLVDGPPTGGAHAVAHYGVTSTVRRADVAAWMLAQLEHDGELPVRQVLLGR